MSSSSSAYSYRPGGSLKFKGASFDDKNKKKNKSKSSTSSDLKKASTSLADGKEKPASQDEAEQQEYHELLSKIKEAQASEAPQMTQAERRFEEMRRNRMHDRIRKEAKLSHKEKVDAFNDYLGSLSEHHDIPKVGPG